MGEGEVKKWLGKDNKNTELEMNLFIESTQNCWSSILPPNRVFFAASSTAGWTVSIKLPQITAKGSTTPGSILHPIIVQLLFQNPSQHSRGIFQHLLLGFGTHPTPASVVDAPSPSFKCNVQHYLIILCSNYLS